MRIGVGGQLTASCFGILGLSWSIIARLTWSQTETNRTKLNQTWCCREICQCPIQSNKLCSTTKYISNVIMEAMGMCAIVHQGRMCWNARCIVRYTKVQTLNLPSCISDLIKPDRLEPELELGLGLECVVSTSLPFSCLTEAGRARSAKCGEALHPVLVGLFFGCTTLVVLWESRWCKGLKCACGAAAPLRTTFSF